MNWSFAQLLAALFSALLILCGCSVNPPKPPICDGSDRRPVNSAHQPVAITRPSVDTCSQG